jgi:prolyl-tRNA synthetase
MDQKFEKKELKKKSDNISDWYNNVVLKAELADYGPVKGTMVIRPYGYALWEKVQQVFDGMIKAAGVQNAYFPLFIPMSYLNKEKDHVKGFTPELAIVTIGGGEKLSEPLAVRPTSETIMYAMYSKWIKSWRDLPLLLNQWCNVVRWEKRTYLFLRTTEFLWQEGHTAHATHDDAIDMVKKAHEWYRQIYEDLLAMPVLMGIKSHNEQFAGAHASYTVEALMPDGKVLQGATSHDLGQNFSKVFDIRFQDRDGKLDHVWQTSWGLSTRALGGLFLVHGDDNGLVLPPNVAPYQVVIIPIYKKDTDTNELKQFGLKLQKDLINLPVPVRVKFDDDENTSPGRKFNDWEVKGVPVRLEIGVKEMESDTVTVAYRDTGEKQSISREKFVSEVAEILNNIQKRMFAKQKSFLTENTHDADTYERFKEIMGTTRGFIRAFWCEDPDCETEIKNDTKATTRCLPMDVKEEKGICVRCGKPAIHRWFFGLSY